MDMTSVNDHSIQLSLSQIVTMWLWMPIGIALKPKLSSGPCQVVDGRTGDRWE